MNGLFVLSTISITSPSYLLVRLFFATIETFTMSPWSAPLSFDAGTNTSSSIPSLMIKAYPSLVMLTFPVDSSLVPPD